MKKILILLFAVLLSPLFFVKPADAHCAEGDEKCPANQEFSLDNTIMQIMKEQGVDSRQNINCSKITDHQFEDLGEAVMNLRHPDPETHEAMDEMMGGEGSESLKNAHIIMGRGYLGCYDENFIQTFRSGGMMMGTNGIIGGSMMNASRLYDNYSGHPFGFMGSMFSGWGGFMAIFTVSLWIFIIQGIIWLIKNLLKK